MGISQNKLVKIDYKGTLNDGTVFDTSEGKQPLEFIFGIGMIIPGLEKGLDGLDVGDKKTIKVDASEAYGPVMDEAVQEVPKEQLPQDAKLEVGMQLAAQGPHGVIPVKIKEIKESTVMVDFNHPLAGEDLTFEVEIKEVKDATEEDKARLLGPVGCSGNCGDGSCEGSNCPSSGATQKDDASLEDALSEEEAEEEKKE